MLARVLTYLWVRLCCVCYAAFSRSVVVVRIRPVANSHESLAHGYYIGFEQEDFNGVRTLINEMQNHHRALDEIDQLIAEASRPTVTRGDA